ncbi:MAG TPA: hypothetical protein VFY98_08405, partial [Intrasporangium sp.]|nr:hypothetical protein [Intrasporangium sp.]
SRSPSSRPGYNLPLVSYNTVPALLLLLATCAIIAAVTRRVAAGPGSAGPPWRSVPLPIPHAPAGLLAALLIALVTLWGGFEAMRATIDFTVDYQSLRPPRGIRLEHSVSAYRAWFGWLVPAAAVVSQLAASLPSSRPGRAWPVWARTALFAIAAVLLTVGMLRGGLDSPAFSPGLGRVASRRPPSSASPAWGSISAVLAPGLVGVMIVQELTAKTRLAECCGRTALVFEQPTAYLLGGARIVSPIIWLVRFEHANQVVVACLTARDATPDCVTMASRDWPPSTELLTEDPLVRWIL